MLMGLGKIIKKVTSDFTLPVSCVSNHCLKLNISYPAISTCNWNNLMHPIFPDAWGDRISFNNIYILRHKFVKDG